MSKNKKILLMLAKGGISQADVAAALHVSKRDVSTGAKAVREFGLTFDSVSEMEADAIDDLLFPKEKRVADYCARTDPPFRGSLVQRVGIIGTVFRAGLGH